MQWLNLPVVAWIVFLAAALFEVGGDSIIRKGLQDGRWLVVGLGAIVLGIYGLVVNLVPWDFSRLLGVYVAAFAVVSILAGKFVFGDQVPTTTWVGLGIIILGALVIQFGPYLSS